MKIRLSLRRLKGQRLAANNGDVRQRLVDFRLTSADGYRVPFAQCCAGGSEVAVLWEPTLVRVDADSLLFQGFEKAGEQIIVQEWGVKTLRRRSKTMSSTALSPRQNRFVQSYCGHLNASRAAREAGYAATSGADAVTGHRLLRNAKARRAIEALQQAKAAELEIDRAAVIAAVLGAIETAKVQGNAATCIQGWVTVAKMAGLDKPETPEDRRNVPLSPGAERLRAHYEAMSDGELLELIAGRE